MNQTIDRKYVVILAVVAILVLTAGALLRPRQESKVDQPSPAESASLQRAVRQEELQRLAGTLADRASSVAEYIAWLPEQRVSGVHWGRRGEVLVPGTARLLATVQTASRQAPPPFAASPAGGGQWLVIAARTATAPLWSAALDGGSRPTTCEGVPYRERSVNVPLRADFLGAGVFDLDGEFLGIVARCGTSFHIVESTSIANVLQVPAESTELYDHYRIRVAALPEPVPAAFTGLSGVLVVEVSRAAPAYEAGLRAGDLILAAGDTPIASPPDLPRAATAHPTQPGTLTVSRLGRRQPLRIALPAWDAPVPADPWGLAAISPSRVPSTLVVREDSPAWRAGLRTGDGILQAGSVPSPTTPQLRAVLESAAAGAPILVIWEREAVEYAGWLTR